MQNNIFTKTRWLVTIILLTFVTSNAWADYVEFTYASSGGWTTTAGAQSGTKSGVTIAATRGAANASNEDLRTYANYEFTVSSENTITKIEFTYSNGSYSLKSGSPGTWNSTTKIWTGSGTSITFTCSVQVRMTWIKVTYTPAASCSTNPSVGNASLNGTLNLTVHFLLVIPLIKPHETHNHWMRITSEVYRIPHHLYIRSIYK